MNFAVTKENFSTGLDTVGRAVATRATLPITQNVLLKAKDGALELVATNLSISIRTRIPAIVQEEGEITLPAKLLSDYIASMDNVRIDCSESDEGKKITIAGGRAKANMNYTEASEFPPFPNPEDNVRTTMAPKDLRRAIDMVAFAAATEESRPVLTGISMTVGGKATIMAAADGFRLAVLQRDAEAEPDDDAEETSAIIPAQSMNELRRLLPSDDSPVEILTSRKGGQMMFKFNDGNPIELTTNLLQGTFPNYDQLIPENHTTKIVVNAKEMLRLARTAAVFSRDGSNILRLEMTKIPEGTEGESTAQGYLKISGRSDEIGESEAYMDIIEMEGEESKIAFNHRYLLDVLSSMEGEEITFEMTTSSSPGVFKPSKAQDYVHVTMPMFVQW